MPIQLKRLDVAKERQQQTERAANGGRKSGRIINLFKDGVTALKWKQGPNYLRLLPQPEGSRDDWFHELWYMSLWHDRYGTKGYFPIADQSLDGDFARIRKMLWDHPEFSSKMKQKDNPGGVDWSSGLKMAFLAFDADAPKAEQAPVPFVLPGTLPFKRRDGAPRKILAGTNLVNMAMNSRKGHPADPVDGTVVCVNVTNPGTMAVDYNISFEDKLDISTGHDHVLEKVKPFSELVNYPSLEDFVRMTRMVLDADMFDFVSEQLGWGLTAQDIEMGDWGEVTESRQSTPETQASIPDEDTPTDPEVTDPAAESDKHPEAKETADPRITEVRSSIEAMRAKLKGARP